MPKININAIRFLTPEKQAIAQNTIKNEVKQFLKSNNVDSTVKSPREIELHDIPEKEFKKNNRNCIQMT